MFNAQRAVCAAAVAVLVTASPALAAEAKPPKAELAKAVRNQNDGKIGKLLAAGAALDLKDDKGATALLYAAQQGNGDLIRTLVDKGAQVDLAGEDGATPLGLALRNPATSLATVQFLLAKGARVDAPDQAGRTPLIQAIRRAPMILDFDSQAAIVSALLAAGADPNRLDNAGYSALHYAAEVGEPRQQLQLLLSAVKDANAVTSRGANLITMAAQGGQHATADYLMAKGFRPVIAAPAAEAQMTSQLLHDPVIRANALGQDWYAQYAGRHGDATASEAAYAAAAPAYDAALIEWRRALGAYEARLVQRRERRRAAQTGVAVANVASALLTAGAATGYQTVYILELQAVVEADERAIARLKAETVEMEARVGELRARRPTQSAGAAQ